MPEGPSLAAWFALQVRSRKEKAVAALLRNRGFEPFLPVWREKRQWSDRIQEIEIPLFPGYLFCYFNPQERYPIVCVPGVQIVGIGRQPAPVHEDEIAALRAAVDSGAPLRSCPYYRTGERVRILGGAMRGLEGIVLKEKNRLELVLSVTLLQRSVAVSIEASNVGPAPPSPGPGIAATEPLHYLTRVNASL